MKLQLSRQEERVLKLLLVGYTQAEIAKMLKLSQSRIQDIKKIIKRKWGVQNDIEFVVEAIRRGLIELERDNMEYDGSTRSCSIPGLIKTNYIYTESLSKTIKITFKD